MLTSLFTDPVNETASIILITENDIKRVSLTGESNNKSQRSLVSLRNEEQNANFSHLLDFSFML